MMIYQIASEQFAKSISILLQETFEKVTGIYLDRGTSLFETLELISADQASKPMPNTGTSIAGHVDHVRYYLRVINESIDGVKHERIDWSQSWLTKTVDSTQWQTLKDALKKEYRETVDRMNRFQQWTNPENFDAPIAIIAHTAYHLGAMRQMMLISI